MSPWNRSSAEVALDAELEPRMEQCAEHLVDDRP